MSTQCCDGDKSLSVNYTTMLVTGVIGIIIGIASFSVDVYSATYIKGGVGAWYVCFPILIAGILCCFATKRAPAIAACVIGSVGLVVVCIGLGVDYIAYKFFVSQIDF